MSKHIDAEGRMAESTMRIKDLAQAEKVTAKSIKKCL